MKHTKGPWTLKGKDGKYLGGATGWRADFEKDDASRAEKAKFKGISSSIPIMNAKGTQAVAIVVSLDPSYDDDEILEANAALISSAPDLLQALKGLLSDIEEYQKINNLGGENNHWQLIARAAIARATGGKDE